MQSEETPKECLGAFTNARFGGTSARAKALKRWILGRFAFEKSGLDSDYYIGVSQLASSEIG